jgi:hypothetical protein
MTANRGEGGFSFLTQRRPRRRYSLLTHVFLPHNLIVFPHSRFTSLLQMKLAVGAVVFVTGNVSAFVSSNPSFGTRTSLFSTATESPARGKTKIPIFDEVCDTTGVTLTRFLTEINLLNPDLRELTLLFGAIDTACKAISNLVKRSQLPSSESLGYEGNVNVQGEDQKVGCVV